MERSKFEISEVRVEDNIDHKHVHIPIHRLRARRLNLALRVKPKKTSSTSTKKKDQELVIAAFPWHEVFMFLNQQFLGALQVEYQNKTKSPFETHPIHMWTFLTSICFYSVILAFKINIKACSSGHFAFTLKHVLLVLGLLSSASLLCIFQPGKHLWFLYVIGIYIALMLAYHLLQNQVLKVLGTIMTSASQLQDYLNLFCGRIGQ